MALLGTSMAAKSITLMDGKLHVYQRDGTPFWQCAAFLGGRNHRATTKETELLRAEEFARGWYAERVVDERRRKRGDLTASDAIAGARTQKRPTPKVDGPTFREAAELFMSEFQIITEGERSPVYVDGHRRRLDGHLLPFFGDRAVASITPGDITAYRAERSRNGLSRKAQAYLQRLRKDDPDAVLDPKLVTKPAATTLHQEIVCLRQVLKTALRHRWIDHLPDMSKPYAKSSKVSHRAWFSNSEYTQLWTETGRRAKAPLKPRWRWVSEQLHDMVLFAGNSGLRPDELARLEFRDVQIVKEDRDSKPILLIEVRGKRGLGHCKTMPGAVLPFKRLSERMRPARVEGDTGAGVGRRAVRKPAQGERLPEPSDLLFPDTHRQLFNTILDELKLKHDRDGQPRTLYSLRHYYICQRLTEGADIYQIAKNCRTSVEMIEKFYASHLANTLDAAAINVRGSKPAGKAFQTKRPVKKSRQPSENTKHF
jgi:integrase